MAGEGGDVSSVAVWPDLRGQGLAAAAMRGFLGQAARRGAAVIHLEVSEANAAARRLYGRLGFEAVGRREAYYADGSDALVLACPLAAAGPRP